jgi:hypothetical protein
MCKNKFIPPCEILVILESDVSDVDLEISKVDVHIFCVQILVCISDMKGQVLAIKVMQVRNMTTQMRRKRPSQRRHAISESQWLEEREA